MDAFDNAFDIMRDVHIGDAFTYRGRRYVLAGYYITSAEDYFTARVFARNGGTRDIRIRWTGVVQVEEV